jgi:hypothetical protein
MKKNVGQIDRVIRIVAGLAILGAGYYFKSWWGIVGFGPLLTAWLGYCPAYQPFGLSTCATSSDQCRPTPPAGDQDRSSTKNV